jgi:hypothetical protein
MPNPASITISSGRKASRSAIGIEPRHVFQPPANAPVLRVQPRHEDPQHIFHRKGRDDKDIENAEHSLPFRLGIQGRLGLQRQEQEAQQDQGDDEEVGDRDAPQARFRHQLPIEPVAQPLLHHQLLHHHVRLAAFPLGYPLSTPPQPLATAATTLSIRAWMSSSFSFSFGWIVISKATDFLSSGTPLP